MSKPTQNYPYCYVYQNFQQNVYIGNLTVESCTKLVEEVVKFS